MIFGGRDGAQAIAHVFAPSHLVNAAFIVRACNAHDDLVAALDRAVQDIDAGWADDAETRFPWLQAARAALAKAGAP